MCIIIRAGSWKLIMIGVAIVFTAGCASTQKSPPLQPQPRKVTRTHVDAKAQQYYYDLGLQLYSKESYREARDAFQQVIENGSNTVLGLKAQENIKKIDQILKTLEDIESK